jgi:hypothetical protein
VRDRDTALSERPGAGPLPAANRSLTVPGSDSYRFRSAPAGRPSTCGLRRQHTVGAAGRTWARRGAARLTRPSPGVRSLTLVPAGAVSESVIQIDVRPPAELAVRSPLSPLSFRANLCSSFHLSSGCAGDARSVWCAIAAVGRSQQICPRNRISTAAANKRSAYDFISAEAALLKRAKGIAPAASIIPCRWR